MKILVIPVFGLMLAACTYQFAPTTSDNSMGLEAESSGETTTAEASFTVPDTDTGFSPGAPGGGGGMGGGPSGPDGDGSDGVMPDMPGMPDGDS